jgi:aspartate-semialdehyde dehydrogenase
MEWETLKILGGLSDAGEGKLSFGRHARTPLRVSASWMCVSVVEGHAETVSVNFARHPAPSPQQVSEALPAFIPVVQSTGCLSAPPQPMPLPYPYSASSAYPYPYAYSIGPRFSYPARACAPQPPTSSSLTRSQLRLLE